MGPSAPHAPSDLTALSALPGSRAQSAQSVPASPRAPARRRLLRAAAAFALVPAGLARAAAVSPLRLAAAWDDAGGRRFAGILEAGVGALAVRAALEVPTRAHGLLSEPGGTLVAVGRRPAEWMLRWRPGAAAAQWWWAGGDRRLSGHVVAFGPDRLATTEVDADSGAGLVALRDRATLEVLAEWPSAGGDTHELLVEADGGLVVANGGVPTRPETGRARLARAPMRSSLVRLDAGGRLVGQWRLDDPRLSLRHLARHADGTLGIALQAEHDAAAQRARGALLARFDGRSLAVAPQPLPLQGYGGSIAATPAGFAVSAPRANAVAPWRRPRPLARRPRARRGVPAGAGRRRAVGRRAHAGAGRRRRRARAAGDPARQPLGRRRLSAARRGHRGGGVSRERAPGGSTAPAACRRPDRARPLPARAPRQSAASAASRPSAVPRLRRPSASSAKYSAVAATSGAR
ncbi:MAG: DUF1513 domain-containing protein [Comamonadaceae bacterium]|nr:DUF1513 domain-containing protein [Comamonadaceae bacterium]